MLFYKLILVAVLICLTSGEVEVKKSTKRGIDDYGYPLGFNGGWTSTLKLNSIHTPPNLLHDRSNVFLPTANDLTHLVEAAKQAAHDVYLAQQYVAAAKEDVLYSQKLIKEKEAQALIAHQKSESAQHALRAEAQNVVLAQQKLAKAKAYASELQIKQAVKDAEAARAIQSSATHANGEIQKAEQAAKLSFYKSQAIKPAFPSFPPEPWSVPHAYPPKHLSHNYHSY